MSVSDLDKFVKDTQKEQDISKRNSTLVSIIEKNDWDIVETIWSYIPTNDNSYCCDEKLRAFVEDRAHTLAYHRRFGMNTTPTIEFSEGSIKPLNIDDSEVLLSEADAELNNSSDWYEYEIDSFVQAFSKFSKGFGFKHGSGLDFAIISPDRDLVGCIFYI